MPSTNRNTHENWDLVAPINPSDKTRSADVHENEQ